MLSYFSPVKKSVFVLLGERVNLRSIQKEDLLPIKEWLKDPELSRFAFGLEAESQVLERIALNYYQQVVANPEYVMGLEEKEHKLIGFLRYTPRPDTSVVKVGIMIGEKAQWSKGLGSEAMGLLVGFLFKVVGFSKIELDTANFNQRAQRSFEKVGFKRTGEGSDLDFLEGSFSHRVFMVMTREEYFK